jgi:alkylated DNA repair dioxygenase AlkB
MHSTVTAHQPPLSNGRVRTEVVSDIDLSVSNLNGDTPNKNSSSPTSSTKPAAKSKQATQSTTTSPSNPLNTIKSSSIADTMKNPLKSLNNKFKNLSNLPSLGPDDVIGEGDSSIKYDLLGKELRDELDPDLRLSDTIFRAIYHEVQWQKMFHLAGEVPRLVAVQGAVDKDGSKPVYRHPSDQSPPLLPFTKYVDIVRKEAEKVVGHPLNHVLIQLYRGGQDYISEHSDKTLDIKRGSKIVNASFGAQRTMRLRTKRSAKQDPAQDPVAAGSSTDTTSEQVPTGVERTTQRIHMPHNSLFVLGLDTNQLWLHGINQDKRAERDRAPEELANNGQRISLTFRLIDTFLSADEQYIWGQGAKNKTKADASKCVNADEAEAERMIDAFGLENRQGFGFNWEKAYGGGFDVLNMKEVVAPAAEASTGIDANKPH